MEFNKIFSARSVGTRVTEDPSNNIAYAGAAFFPDLPTMGIDMKWFLLNKVVGTALKPSAFNAMSTIRPRKGFEGKVQEMPLFRESMKIDERDLLDIQRAESKNDPYLLEIIDHIYDDTSALIEGANISAERMRMNLLAPVNGEMKIIIGMADNTLYSYNYDPDGEWKKEHYLEITSGSTWDKPQAAKPLTDIRQGTTYLKSNGSAPAYAMMTSKTFEYLADNEQIQNSFITSSGKTVDFIDTETLKDVFRRKTGLIPLLYDKVFMDYDENSTKKNFFPDDYVTIIGATKLGNTHRGITPEQRTLMGDKAADVYVLENGIAIATKTTYGPPVVQEVTASMLALPSFEGMNDIFTLKVK